MVNSSSSQLVANSNQRFLYVIKVSNGMLDQQITVLLNHVDSGAITVLGAPVQVSAFATVLLQHQIVAYTLIPGRRYTFALVCNGAAVEAQGGYVSVVANGAPRLGWLKVAPERGGVEISTPFNLTAVGWVDDDLPLSYMFAYLMPSFWGGNAMMTIQPFSLDATMTSGLPAGAGFYDTLEVVVQVRDVYWAPSESYATPQVLKQPAGTSGHDLGNMINSSGVSVVASVVVRGDCSAAPANLCARLNRERCSGMVTATCGPCLEAFPLGAEGSANSPCAALGTNLEDEMGAGSCSASEPCTSVFKRCNEVTGECEGVPMSCPVDCSGHGECLSHSTATYAQQAAVCLDGDPTCYRACTCADGFHGDACELNTEEFAVKVERMDQLVRHFQAGDPGLFVLLTSAPKLLSASSIEKLVGEGDSLVTSVVADPDATSADEWSVLKDAEAPRAVDAGRRLADVATTTVGNVIHRLCAFVAAKGADSTSAIMAGLRVGQADGSSLGPGAAGLRVSAPQTALEVADGQPYTEATISRDPAVSHAMIVSSKSGDPAFTSTPVTVFVIRLYGTESAGGAGVWASVNLSHHTAVELVPPGSVDAPNPLAVHTAATGFAAPTQSPAPAVPTSLMHVATVF